MVESIGSPASVQHRRGEHFGTIMFIVDRRQSKTRSRWRNTIGAEPAGYKTRSTTYYSHIEFDATMSAEVVRNRIDDKF